MSFDLVFFGGTGDLTWRKLMPALFQAFRHGKLPRRRPHPRRWLATSAATTQYRACIKERFVDVDRREAPERRASSRASPRCCTTGAWTCRSRSDYAAPEGLAR